MAHALLIVDVQRDFMPGGPLAVAEGDRVIDPINALSASGRFALVVATRDWHPPDHASFVAEGGPWPEHCVRETPGAQLDPRVDLEPIDAVIDKGTGRAADGYSAFEVEALGALLRDAGVDAVTVTGVATDFCVLHTARDALRQGLRVTVDSAAVRGIDEAGTAAALRELEQAGATIV